ncbi:hypothetical protein VNO78_25602 [Psophocarpus tetragonolobus]|uniref:TIR domain-containing protein n=1 Tax=Psophocarpus tetragonolobus TaxID=3891 RepID=A0AAN9XFH6_PSOTE
MVLEEAELVQEIIKEVDHKLIKRRKHSFKSEGLIGIDKSVTRIESLLREKPEDVRIIGIWGMAGIGKTIIAEEVFNRDSSGSAEIARLKDKALITNSENGDICMDDITKQMAWEIVREESTKEPGRRSHLLDPDDIYEVLNNDKGTAAIRSIKVNFSQVRKLKLSPLVFAKMNRLQYLLVHMDKYSPGDERYDVLPQGLQYVPSDLKYLCWTYYPLESLPEQFSAEKLVILDLTGSLITRIWKGVKVNTCALNVVNLKELILRECTFLQELPDFIKAENLRRVDLTSCYQLMSVHPSIFSLIRLKDLKLDECNSITTLSGNICSSSLDFLDLSGCPKLREFSVLTTESLINLDLSNTSVHVLPSSCVHDNKFYSLVLRNCAIERLPLCTKNLTELAHLDLSFSAKPMSNDAPQIEYDVFVSFRGEDVREGFLSHLKRKFRDDIQINTFWDYKLTKGQEIWPSLQKRI